MGAEHGAGPEAPAATEAQAPEAQEAAPEAEAAQEAAPEAAPEAPAAQEAAPEVQAASEAAPEATAAPEAQAASPDALGAVDEDVDGGKGRITTQLYLLNICEVTC